MSETFFGKFTTSYQLSPMRPKIDILEDLISFVTWTLPYLEYEQAKTVLYGRRTLKKRQCGCSVVKWRENAVLHRLFDQLSLDQSIIIGDAKGLPFRSANSSHRRVPMLKLLRIERNTI